MGYSIDWSDLEQRIQDQKAALLDTSQNMDPERLKFLVETYDECKGESVFITRAKLFEKVLTHSYFLFLEGGYDGKWPRNDDTSSLFINRA